MIKRIVCLLFLITLFIAIPISLAGITHVEMGEDLLAFLSKCSADLNGFKIEIPNIPDIPLVNVGGLDIVINFINGIVALINVVILILNIGIKVIQFIIIIVINLVGLVNVTING